MALERLIGLITILDNWLPGSIVTFNRYQAEATGLLTQFRMYTDGAVNVKLAIYTDDAGSPGTLIESKTVNLPGTAYQLSTGWNVPIVSGVWYWIATNADNNNTGMLFTLGTRKYKNATYATWTWPSPWTNGSYSANNYRTCIDGWGTLVSAPTVQTDPADNIDHESANLHGTLTEDGGEACEVRFQYGQTDAYGTDTEWQPGNVSEDTFEQLITGLDPDQLYHFRAQAKNSAGTESGSDAEFTTSILPPVYGATKRAQITHPALKTVRIIQYGQEVAKFDELSNPDQSYIESGLTIHIPTPSTVEVTTLADQTWEFNIPEK